MLDGDILKDKKILIVDDEPDILETLTELDLDELRSRQHIWAANLKAANKFPWVGTGVGSHSEIYRVFYEQSTRLEYSHAESGYLQLLTETGLVGLGLFLMGVYYCLRWSLRAVRSTSSPRARSRRESLAPRLSIVTTSGDSLFPRRPTGTSSTPRRRTTTR